MKRHPELDRLAHRLSQAAATHYDTVRNLKLEAEYLAEVSPNPYGLRGGKGSIADPTYRAMLAADSKLRLIEDLNRSVRTIAGAVAAYERALRAAAPLSPEPSHDPAPLCRVEGCDLLVEHYSRTDGTIAYRKSGLCAGHRSEQRRAGVR